MIEKNVIIFKPTATGGILRYAYLGDMSLTWTLPSLRVNVSSLISFLIFISIDRHVELEVTINEAKLISWTNNDDDRELQEYAVFEGDVR